MVSLPDLPTIDAIGYIVASCVDGQLIVDNEVWSIAGAEAMVNSFDAERRLCSVIVPVKVSLAFEQIAAEMTEAFRKRTALLLEQNKIPGE